MRMMGMLEVGMTTPQLKLTIGKNRLETEIWMWGQARSGLTILKLRLELMREVSIGAGSDGLGTKSWR